MKKVFSFLALLVLYVSASAQPTYPSVVVRKYSLGDSIRTYPKTSIDLMFASLPGNGANNYPTGLTFNTTSRNLLLSRNGLPDLQVNIPVGATYAALPDKPMIPAQFNPIAGTNITFEGVYPNIKINAASDGGGSSVTNGIYVSYEDVPYNPVTDIFYNPIRPNKSLAITGNITININNTDTASDGLIRIKRGSGNETIAFTKDGSQVIPLGNMPTGANAVIVASYKRANDDLDIVIANPVCACSGGGETPSDVTPPSIVSAVQVSPTHTKITYSEPVSYSSTNYAPWSMGVGSWNVRSNVAVNAAIPISPTNGRATEWLHSYFSPFVPKYPQDTVSIGYGGGTNLIVSDAAGNALAAQNFAVTNSIENNLVYRTILENTTGEPQPIDATKMVVKYSPSGSHAILTADPSNISMFYIGSDSGANPRPVTNYNSFSSTYDKRGFFRQQGGNGTAWTALYEFKLQDTMSANVDDISFISVKAAAYSPNHEVGLKYGTPGVKVNGKYYVYYDKQKFSSPDNVAINGSEFGSPGGNYFPYCVRATDNAWHEVIAFASGGAAGEMTIDESNYIPLPAGAKIEAVVFIWQDTDYANYPVHIAIDDVMLYKKP